MARRATYFNEAVKTDSQRLLISGGWEFIRPEKAIPPQEMTIALARAMELLKYDVGLLAGEEAKALADEPIPYASTRKTAAEEPVTVITLGDGSQISFIRFPSLKKRGYSDAGIDGKTFQKNSVGTKDSTARDRHDRLGLASRT